MIERKLNSAFILEDVQSNQQVIAGLLKELGISDIVTTPSAKQAIEILRADKYNPDVIIADLKVIDAAETGLLDFLRDQDPRYKEKPILIVTGLIDIEPKTIESNYNPCLVLAKPFTKSTFNDSLFKLYG